MIRIRADLSFTDDLRRARNQSPEKQQTLYIATLRTMLVNTSVVACSPYIYTATSADVSVSSSCVIPEMQRQTSIDADCENPGVGAGTGSTRTEGPHWDVETIYWNNQVLVYYVGASIGADGLGARDSEEQSHRKGGRSREPGVHRYAQRREKKK